MFKSKFTCAAIALLVCATPAVAEWHHAVAPMGQFEGSGTADGMQIDYSCAGYFTSFNGKAPYFSAGMRVLGIAAIFTYQLDFAWRKSKYAV